jgi:hypothetical protein
MSTIEGENFSPFLDHNGIPSIGELARLYLHGLRSSSTRGVEGSLLYLLEHHIANLLALTWAGAGEIATEVVPQVQARRGDAVGTGRIELVRKENDKERWSAGDTLPVELRLVFHVEDVGDREEQMMVSLVITFMLTEQSKLAILGLTESTQVLGHKHSRHIRGDERRECMGNILHILQADAQGEDTLYEPSIEMRLLALLASYVETAHSGSVCQVMPITGVQWHDTSDAVGPKSIRTKHDGPCSIEVRESMGRRVWHIHFE